MRQRNEQKLSHNLRPKKSVSKTVVYETVVMQQKISIYLTATFIQKNR